MEQLNATLYEKYKNLKKRKLFEEEWDHKRDAEIRNYQLATEDLIEELKNENERLYTELSSLQERYAESEKLFLEETQKTKELSSEVGRLQLLLSQRSRNNDIAQMGSPNRTNEVGSKESVKSSAEKRTPNSSTMRSRENSRSPGEKMIPNSLTNQGALQHKEAAIFPHDVCQMEQNKPDCCRRNLNCLEDQTGKGSVRCVFHTLIEVLVGMKFSVGIQEEELCLSVSHDMSGYTFSLTWVAHESGGGDLMYRVSSLGTLERIAVDWMKEDMIFSMTMCRIFFDRISRVLGRG
ncbi:uncharacterized protein [Typha angustifolia]|uniref:uncharacterized protein isoform X1 n=1 Tax=Typha angustifolia TaxID=59011 RepID=UPI003C2DCA8B